ncbi:MAG: UTP--glucose-1-phosphate uridylyltransferase [Lysobacterales bacterium]|jgi:UTP--glucose-1-phosphate uridylyltransferase
MKRQAPVRKAVFPVAGLGTRFLPATKSIPKEMLPVVDKPLIQYAVEEAIEAGIDTLILVTRGDKQAISDHFQRSEQLEQHLESKNQHELLEIVRGILPSGVTLLEAIQEQPLGLGHAVLCARAHVDGEPFAVILPDDMVRTSSLGCLSQMLNVYHQTGSNIIGVERIAPELTGQYGIAAAQENASGHLLISELVEKPQPKDAPSDLGVVGRYILNNEIFRHLVEIGAGAGGEIQLTDGIARLMAERDVLAFPFEGTRYDCGSRLGFIQATIDYALADEALAEPLLHFLKEKNQDISR